MEVVDDALITIVVLGVLTACRTTQSHGIKEGET